LLAVQAGSFEAFRCKLNLAITCSPTSTTACTGAVTPLATTAPGRAVASGSTLTLAGEDFGTKCSNCNVYATPAGATSPTTLTVSSWTNTAISVVLPASLTGYQTLQVNGVAGVDSIGVRAVASVSSTALSLTPTSLSFAYTLGAATPPASQSLSISNSGSGTLAWTAAVSTSASWLSIDSSSGTAPSTVNASVSPGSLSAGTYTGSITITATGASNSPATVTVTLVVSAPAAVLVVTPTTLSFQFASGGAVPASQVLSISNGGGGTLTWVASSNQYWAALSATSGSLPATVNLSLIPQNLAAGTYTATVTVAATVNGVSPVTVAVTLTVTGTPPAPAITAVANAGGYQTNFASATWVAIFGTNLSQTTYSWQESDFLNGALPTSLEGISVTINGFPAYVSYISPTQINVLAPDDPSTGSVPVEVIGAQTSSAFAAQKVQFSPAFLTFNGTYVAAEHLAYSLLGPPGLFPGATTTPAAPGETIILYGVGFGPTTPAQPTGQLVTSVPVLANSVTMTIGGIAVTPSFAGLSSSGLYQFNVTVPASLGSGDAAVTATIGGVTTQTGVLVTVQ
jgi:uncharacterized protein (TIGR03437 family)